MSYNLEGMLDKLRPLYKEAVEKAKRESTAEKKRGVGISIGIYGCGLDGPDASEIAVELTPEGITVYSSWEDHGQGADMGCLATAHEGLRPLGIGPEKIKLIMNDTAITPNSGPAGGSRSQVMTGQAIRVGCEMLVNAMKKPDGTFRTYDEMVKENIPLRYGGQMGGFNLYGMPTRTPRVTHSPFTCMRFSWLKWKSIPKPARPRCRK